MGSEVQSSKVQRLFIWSQFWGVSVQKSANVGAEFTPARLWLLRAGINPAPTLETTFPLIQRTPQP